MKKLLSFGLVTLAAALLLAGCADKAPTLAGFYQSDFVGSEIVQITVNGKSGEFIEYISNRTVNTGTVTKQSDGAYRFEGDLCTFTATLESDDSFSVTIPKLNDGAPILLQQISKDKGVFSTVGDQESFADIEQYRSMLVE